MGRTIAQKIWDSHTVARIESGDMLYVDMHFIHDLSAQAFGALEEKRRTVRRPDLTFATMDHAVPTTPGVALAGSAVPPSLARLQDNCAAHGIKLAKLYSEHQGIVHVIGPEMGLTLPGSVIACGDSHTATHGALGALAFGIGLSQVEHVLSTQMLALQPLKQMAVTIRGNLTAGVTAKDVALAYINRVGFSGASGHVVEFMGPVIDSLSVEERMSLCNMSAESGARSAIIAPDDKVVRYAEGRPYAPTGRAWDRALEHWSNLHSDTDAEFDLSVEIDGAQISPTVTWGTNPEMSAPVHSRVPSPDDWPDPSQAERALNYMGLEPGTRIQDIAVDQVFIGSCVNGRIEDLRAAAAVLCGRKLAAGVRGIVVPGSMAVRKQAEEEGLDRVFIEAGMEWRFAGCSMCLGMNPDVLGEGERCASTSNRNFEGRQGRGGRTHLVSPPMAAAAAVMGHFVDVREMM